MIAKNYFLVKEMCRIIDPSGGELKNIQVKDKSFPIKWKKKSKPSRARLMTLICGTRDLATNPSTMKEMRICPKFLKILLRICPKLLKILMYVMYFSMENRTLPFSSIATWRLQEDLQLTHKCLWTYEHGRLQWH